MSQKRKNVVFRVNDLFFLVSALIYLVSHFLIRLHFHELWKDEWQAWFVVRDMGWSEMFSFLYYEGHPSFWYVYLKAFTYLGDFFSSEVLIKVAHFFPFAGFVFLISRFKAVLLHIRGLFLLGYFPLFEYGMISRGYIWVMFFTFLTLYIILNERKSTVGLAISLFLLCQTEIYGVIAGGGLMLYYVMTQTHFSFGQILRSIRLREVLIPALGLLAGVIVFYITINWASDAAEVRARLVNIMSSFQGKSGWSQAVQGIFGHAFWPGIASAESRTGTSGAGLVLVILTIVSLIFLFRHTWRVGLVFGLYGFIVLYFAATTYSGGMRQWGMTFIFFMACIFMIYSRHKWTSKVPEWILILILSVQFYFGFIALFDEVRHPFTNAEKAGTYIRQEVRPEIPIVGISPFNVAAASGYADRIFYGLPDGEPFTYFRWLDKVYMPPESELVLFAGFKRSQQLIVITHQKADPTRYPSLTLLQSFDQFNLKDENFYLYLLEVARE